MDCFIFRDGIKSKLYSVKVQSIDFQTLATLKGGVLVIDQYVAWQQAMTCCYSAKSWKFCLLRRSEKQKEIILMMMMISVQNADEDSKHPSYAIILLRWQLSLTILMIMTRKEFLALGQPCGLGSRLDCLGKPVKAWSEHSMSHHTSSSPFPWWRF